jgi:hypothetical protein
MWMVLWVLVAIAGFVGLLAAANSLRFGRRVAHDTEQLLAAAGPARRVQVERIASMPAPVRRYLEIALGRREVTPRTVRLRHGGTFRASLDGGWFPIRGAQYFTTDPPGFVWWGRIRMVPGLWVDARDRSVAGAGSMLVLAESTITLADSSGPALDQGALARLLGEMVWFPTAFLDERYIRWAALDDRRARATLAVNGREVTAVFAFGDDGLPAAFSADRYRDVGGGKSVLTPFSGQTLDYRPVDGILVPHRMIAAWHVDGQEQQYVRFEVERLEFDATGPY